MTSKPHIGPMLRLVLLAGALLSPLANPLLQRRLKRGKEDPVRWVEKLGQATQARPDGPLIWLHGVGVGEVMALRGLIERLAAARPALNFLVTSSARSSGDVFAKNMPARTIHQYLPLDLPKAVNSFLDHWQPDLAVWSDQEIWPRMAVTVARRGIPQAYVAARITNASAKAKSRFGAAYGDLFRLLDLRHAQDNRTAAHLSALMGNDTPVAVTGSLKATAGPLVDDPIERQMVVERSGRPIWLVASAHPVDIDAALDAQQFALTEDNTQRLLIIAPRDVSHADRIATGCDALGLAWRQRSTGARPDHTTDVYIADTYGELGLWYRAAFAAVIGGTFDATQGHNPWEAVAVSCPVLHGPMVRNFAADFAQLADAKASIKIGLSDNGAAMPKTSDIVAALNRPDLKTRAERATAVRTVSAKGVQKTTSDILALIDATDRPSDPS